LWKGNDMDWNKKPFKDYLNTVDDLLKTFYGITSDDTGMTLITVCHKAGETPKECIQQIADKYELENIGHYLENLLYA
jgi:hypothetical protein